MNDTQFTDPISGIADLNITYTVCEVLVAVMAIIGNAMVIIVFRKERKLRRRTNYYIISLATADFLVGLLGIPFAIMASIGLPRNFYACLFTVSLLVVLCTISIFCLVAVSVDRYWAILHPMGYSRNVRTKTALVIISICWIAGTFIGFLPLLGWNASDSNQKCLFVKVMRYDYLVFLYFATIITPSLLLAAFYAHIYRVVLKQLRQIVTMNPGGGNTNGHVRQNGGTMLRMLGPDKKSEVKATQNLSFIVLFFVICWFPLYTINCVQAFCKDCKIPQTLVDFCIILSHLNSAGNPLLYAYHLRDFRAALKNYILGLFGVKSSTQCVDRSCRPSLISNNCSHKIKYVRNTNTKFSRQVDNRRLPICMPIVQGTATVAAISAGERNNRHMCIIAEMPSTSVSERENQIFPEIESDSSGKINSGYVEGPIDDLELGDDDVFYADNSTLSQNGSESSDIFKLTKQYYNSSPQLSRTLFLVEAQVNRKSVMSLSNDSPAKSLKLSPFKATFKLQSSINQIDDNDNNRNGKISSNS